MSSPVKFLNLLVLFTLSLYSCNRVNEHNPQPESVPIEVVQIVKDAFPDAVDLVFKPIVAQQIWNANFNSTGKRYSTVVDQNRLLSASELLDMPVPDSLRQAVLQTSFAGGQFSNFRSMPSIQGDPLHFLAEYEWKGQNFTIKWFPYQAPQLKYLIMINRATVSEFYLYTTDILPQTIKDFLAIQHSTLKTGVQVNVAHNGTKTYGIGSKTSDPGTYNLIFDDSGNLVYSYMDKVDYYNHLSDYPPEIQNFVSKNADYNGFEFFWGIRFEDGTKSGYRLDLTKNGKAEENLHLYFNDKGMLTEQKYNAYIR